jgi:acyl carrier protein
MKKEFEAVNMSDTLMRFICNVLLSHHEEKTLTEDDDLLTSGRINSLGIMQLVSFIEEEFQVTVPAEDVTLENFRSVRTITGYLEQQVAIER